MFKKILLPIDLSNRHDQALLVASELAKASGGEVVLLHVVAVIPGLPEEEGFYSRLERVARKQLEHLHEWLTKEKVPSHVETLVGNRAKEVIRRAQEIQADLVILTAPRVDPEHVPAGLGSMSYKVGIFAHCPVLLVK